MISRAVLLCPLQHLFRKVRRREPAAPGRDPLAEETGPASTFQNLVLRPDQVRYDLLQLLVRPAVDHVDEHVIDTRYRIPEHVSLPFSYGMVSEC